MGTCGGENCGEFLPEAGRAVSVVVRRRRGGQKKNLRSVAEEEYHYQCVWETHFGTVYKAVSEALNDGEDVMVFGVKYESVYRCLGGLAVVSEGLCGGGEEGVHQDNIHGAGHRDGWSLFGGDAYWSVGVCVRQRSMVWGCELHTYVRRSAGTGRELPVGSEVQLPRCAKIPSLFDVALLEISALDLDGSWACRLVREGSLGLF